MKNIFFIILFTVSVTCSAQLFQKIGQIPIQGYFYDKNGNKQEGKLQVYCSTNFGVGTFIRISQNEGKRKKITKTKMKSFVIGTDSFALISNFSPGALTYYDDDFAKVVNTGAINLYRHFRRISVSTGPNSIPITTVTNSYVINLSGTSKFYAITNRSTFEEFVLPAIADYTELYRRVMLLKKRDWFRSLESYISEYNQFKAAKQ